MREAGGKKTWKPILSRSSERKRRFGIYRARELRELIVYERARADRTRDHLSIVICSLNGRAGSQGFVKQAIQALSRSIRQTDHLGWYDRQRLAVVLPLTTHEGAEQFTESLRAMPDSEERRVANELEFSIHSYPDEWLAEDKAGGAHPGGEDAGLCFTRSVPLWKRVLDVVGSSARGHRSAHHSAR